MPTIILPTTTQASGISYAWDRDYDLKTVAQAQAEYLRLRDQLQTIPQTLAAMEALAAQDGFSLPTADFRSLVEHRASALLRGEPGKVLVLLVPSDSFGALSWELPLLMPYQLYQTEFETGLEKGSFANRHPTQLVDLNGRAWRTYSATALAEAHALLAAGDYWLLTCGELGIVLGVEEV